MKKCRLYSLGKLLRQKKNWNGKSCRQKKGKVNQAKGNKGKTKARRYDNYMSCRQKKGRT